MGASQSNQHAKKEQVFITGLHAAYPESVADNEYLMNVVPKIDNGNGLAKLRAINERTGIKSRPVILHHDHEFYHRSDPFKVEELTQVWLEHGIPLSHKACLGAINDWGGSINDITHLIVASCSVQSHPGIDAYLAQRLGLQNVNRTLLTGVGCAGTAVLLRTAYEFAAAMTCRNRAARILVVACDINSLGFRSELEQLKQGRFPIGLTLFSDAAAAAIVSNGVGMTKDSRRFFEIQTWVSHTIPNTLDELQLMPTSIGLVSTISKNLPKLIPDAVQKTFFALLSSLPPLVGSDGKIYRSPSDFDWDIHPGGLDIYERISRLMGLTKDNTTATVTAYKNWGNSAGPTLLKVLDVRRSLPMKREYIVCCGFGNNVDVTMLILKRPRA